MVTSATSTRPPPQFQRPARGLQDGTVTDEEFLQARQAHLITFGDYVRRQPALAAALPERGNELYEPVTAETAIAHCCDHLLATLGMQTQFPEGARAVLSEPVPRISFSVPDTAGVNARGQAEDRDSGG